MTRNLKWVLSSARQFYYISLVHLLSYFLHDYCTALSFSYSLLITLLLNYCSVQFSCSVVSNSLQPHRLQQTWLPCPSLCPGVCSNTCPLSCWCHPTISFPVGPFSSSPQCFQHHGLFKWVRSSHQVAKVLEFQLQHQSFQWHPGQISFRMDWLDLFVVQGILKSLLQHHSSKASILLCSAFFTVQLSHLHMNIGKTIALTRWTFVDKVMSLLFNMLSRLVITFLPRSSVQSLRCARLFVTPWT